MSATGSVHVAGSLLQYAGGHTRVTEALIDPAPMETQLAYYRMSAATPGYRPELPVIRRAAKGRV